MTEAATWLAAQTEGAPETLRARMLDAIASAAGDDVADTLANAALACLQDVMQDPRGPAAALQLLAADALLTHACAAAAEGGEAALLRFTARFDAARFQLLLEGAA